MRILQVTNIISHHQLPLARCLAKDLGEGNFRFATTDPPDPERQQLGWSNETNEPWILRAGEYAADEEECRHWWETADVVLCGERLFDLIERRLERGQLTFYMSERWFKPRLGRGRLLFPKYLLMVLRFRRLALSRNFHYLSMGEHAITDMRKIASFPGRSWRWGYFTALPEPLPSCNREATDFKVLWVGRMLRWKRVDVLIRAFAALVTKQSDASLTIVGDGPERTYLHSLANRLMPTSAFRFLPPRAAGEIAELMRQHHVYVLPSSGCEGWGAVVNEAMAEGCAVIASNAAGSAQSIIKHQKNGLLFHLGDRCSLHALLALLKNDRLLCERLACAGQLSIQNAWSPQIAAERFLAVASAMLSRQAAPQFIDGPMTKF